MVIRSGDLCVVFDLLLDHPHLLRHHHELVFHHPLHMDAVSGCDLRWFAGQPARDWD